AARLLAGGPAGPRLDSGPLLCHASGLLLRGRLLGLPAGRPRPAVRAGLLQAAAVGDARLVLPAELLRQLPRPVRFALRPAGVRPLLLRRLLRPRLLQPGFRALVCPRPALARSAVRLLRLAAPGRPGLVPGAGRYLPRAGRGRSAAAAADLRPA